MGTWNSEVSFVDEFVHHKVNKWREELEKFAVMAGSQLQPWKEAKGGKPYLISD